MPNTTSLPEGPAGPRRRNVLAILAGVLVCVATLYGVTSLDEPGPRPSREGLTGSDAQPCGGQEASSCRPYSQGGPWNTPIPPGTATSTSSERLIGNLKAKGLPLSADPDNYTVPVYTVDENTSRVRVRLTGYFSAYGAGDTSRVGHGYAPVVDGIPVPRGAQESAGSDGHIVIWDPTTGTEFGFWQWSQQADGTARATNGYRYKVGPRSDGRFADGLSGRGAGTPYLAGLVRKWEIDRGRIEHALAFAYDSPSPDFVFPATKSDGLGVRGVDLPEGARLQLNPGLSEADLRSMGLSDEGMIIARALQSYGMYVVDNSGSSKIYLEDRKTAEWPPWVNRVMLQSIPWDEFRVVTPPRHSAAGLEPPRDER